jgi:hypothetical protein
MKIKKVSIGYLVDPPLDEYDLNEKDFTSLGYYKNTKELALGFQFRPKNQRKELYTALYEMIKYGHNTAVFGEIYGDFMYTKKE